MGTTADQAASAPLAEEMATDRAPVRPEGSTLKAGSPRNVRGSQPATLSPAPSSKDGLAMN